MPDWADAFLAGQEDGDIFATRLWYDTLLAHALPRGSVAELALVGEGGALLPLLRGPGGLRALTTPYTLDWRPLLPQADAASAQAAGRSLGGWLRHRAPLRLEAMDPEAPGLRPLRLGLAEAGIAVQAYRHFGNWHEPLAPGGSWDSYVAGRPPALRSTIQRKLRRAAREFRFEAIDAPGAALAQGIAAYEAVRAASWKPPEPFPDFDGALMRAAAEQGALRLGVLRDEAGHPVAAQYWLLSGGRAWLLKLCHVEAARGASPGTALTALMIRGLIERDAARELDFGRGDDAYKQLWVSRRRQRIGLVLAHAWHPAGFVAVARHRIAGWLGRGA
ncbi:GNAT family N-acetyltransferase [Roseococcus sp. SYP-B2431]|uniref:GNAT family N-acetyltransferase n=1 Tax=Roseococcus sp. SYP-B2431 TaxID=2496640 RepID=UPI0013F41305|nr:GNAT family N-acetyltransferase [Roseococcus sp. SYP-B2431]